MFIMESSVRRTGVSVVLTLATIILAGTAVAAVPEKISYQGRLTDTIGSPIDTIVDLTFTIFADEAGTSDLWTETHPDVVIENGLFAVTLGKFTSFGPSLFNGQTRYLGIQLSGGSMSSPLIAMVSTPYSLRSTYSDTASYAHAGPGSGATGWTDDGSTVRLTTIGDSVGIGTTDPRAPLEVQGAGHAIIGESHGSGTSAGVLGTNNSNGFGLMGVSINGRAVTGLSTSGFGGYFYGPKNYFSSNLGIGTETPEEMLHVYRNDIGGSSFIMVQSDHASSWGETGLKFETPQNLWYFRMDDNSNAQIPSGAIGLRSNSFGEVMTWRDNGHVGIGTTSPNYPLELVSSSTPLRSRCTGSGIGIYTSSSSGYGVYSDATKNYMGGITGFGTTGPTHRVTVNGAIGIQAGGTTKFHINYYNGGLNFSETNVGDYRINIEEGGNVGIGTGIPQQRLHVNGNAQIDGTLMADDFEDNSINRYDIVDEVGIASVNDNTLSDLSPGWTSYLSEIIVVPSAGYILSLGSAHCKLYHQADGHSQARIVISDLPNDAHGGYSARFYLGENVAHGDYACTIRCRRLFFVDSPGAYTFYLLAQRDAADTDYEATIDVKQMDLLFIPTAYSAKKKANGSDPDYAATGRTDDQSAVHSVSNTTSAGSGEIGQLRSELTSLQQTVEELKSRLEAEGR